MELNRDVFTYGRAEPRRRPSAVCYPKIFARDNLGPNRKSNRADEFALFSLDWGNTRLPENLRADKPFESRAVTRLSTENLGDAVASAAGAILPKRDSVDQRVAASLHRHEGRMINSPSEVGGHPDMKRGEPPVDFDHDGMPDNWEKQMGFNPQDATDAAADHDGDGYTNIEEYLHWLTSSETIFRGPPKEF